MNVTDLVNRLWESDAASALTNEAARRIEKLEADRSALAEACLEFVRKVDNGEARSRKSYAQIKTALEQAGITEEEPLVTSEASDDTAGPGLR